MTHTIARLVVKVLRLFLPGPGVHRSGTRQVPEPALFAPEPLPRICRWSRPIHPHHLIRNMPPVSLPFRVGGWVEQWERTPEPEQRAILAERAERQHVAWLRFRTEWEKTHDTPAKRQRRRIAAFAAGADLPDLAEFETDMREAMAV
ncbi:hypothetical protein [Kitasatospora cineracea]|uniref:hypothetical protein n=1 Tax=Kitasatospora cineracea TaxID=88074 RepID=UPI0037B81F2C